MKLVSADKGNSQLAKKWLSTKYKAVSSKSEDKQATIPAMGKYVPVTVHQPPLTHRDLRKQQDKQSKTANGNMEPGMKTTER